MDLRGSYSYVSFQICLSASIFYVLLFIFLDTFFSRSYTFGNSIRTIQRSARGKDLFLIHRRLTQFTYVISQNLSLQRSLLKCKCFTVAELTLIVLKLVLSFILVHSIGYIIWTLIVIGLRGYGIWIIGKFIRKVESDLGQVSTFPWRYFPEPTSTQNTSADLPTASHI